MPCGRFMFWYIPRRRPVTTVGKIILFIDKKNPTISYFFLVGKTIHVNKNINATPDDIDQLHCKYIQAVEQLFEYNKNKYGLEHVNLEIV